MKEILGALIHSIEEISLRRTIALLILAVISVGVFFAYDRYTSSFTLGRLNQAADLLSKLKNIEATGNMSPELRDAYSKLLLQVNTALVERPFFPLDSWKVPNMTPSITMLYKFLAGMAPWIFFSLFVIGDIRKKGKDAISSIIGMLLFGFMVGVVGSLLPTVWWPWFNLIVYPLVVPLGLICIMGVIVLRVTKNSNVKIGSDSKT